MLSVYSVLDSLLSFLIYCSRHCSEGRGWIRKFILFLAQNPPCRGL